MKRDSNQQNARSVAGDRTGQSERPPSTRRAFLGDVGRKALFVTPVVLTLTAAQAHAAISGSCTPSGADCTIDAECCTLDCSGGGMCAMCGSDGDNCTADTNCCSASCGFSVPGECD